MTLGQHTAQRRLGADPTALTHVELTWIEKRIEHWIRFGHGVAETVLDRRRRILSFAPNSLIAFVRWAANDYGTVVSRIDIVRTVARGEPYQVVPLMRPGAEILLRVSGWPKVHRVLEIVDAVEALDIDAAAAAPDYWRHVDNRVAVGETPRSYDLPQHQAWLLRQRLCP